MINHLVLVFALWVLHPTQDPRWISSVVHWAEQAATESVPADLIISLASYESGFDPKAVSPAGACGLMQIMAKGKGWRSRRPSCEWLMQHPQRSIEKAVAILARFQDGGCHSLDKLLCAYNSGRCGCSRESVSSGYSAGVQWTMAWVKAARAMSPQAVKACHLTARRTIGPLQVTVQDKTPIFALPPASIGRRGIRLLEEDIEARVMRDLRSEACEQLCGSAKHRDPCRACAIVVASECVTLERHAGLQQPGRLAQETQQSPGFAAR